MELSDSATRGRNRGGESMNREVVAVCGVRTAIGKFGGSLKELSPTELGTAVVREVLDPMKHSGH